MKEYYPLKHHIEGGLYTREIFMPKGHLTISFIHKQQHPSFLMKGKVSFVNEFLAKPGINFMGDGRGFGKPNRKYIREN